MIASWILDNVVDHLLDEEGGLSSSRAGVNEYNTGISKNSIFLLTLDILYLENYYTKKKLKVIFGIVFLLLVFVRTDISIIWRK